MCAPKTVDQPDLQRWVHDVPLAVLEMFPDCPERETAMSHIRLGYAKALMHLVRGKGEPKEEC